MKVGYITRLSFLGEPPRATEPYNIHVVLVLLYGAMPPSASPVTSATPPKTDRNKEIYQRYQAGESPSALACEYGISEQRIFVIIRKQRSRNNGPNT